MSFFYLQLLVKVYLKNGDSWREEVIYIIYNAILTKTKLDLSMTMCSHTNCLWVFLFTNHEAALLASSHAFFRVLIVWSTSTNCLMLLVLLECKSMEISSFIEVNQYFSHSIRVSWTCINTGINSAHVRNRWYNVVEWRIDVNCCSP